MKRKAKGVSWLCLCILRIRECDRVRSGKFLRQMGKETFLTKISLPVWPLSLPLRPCAAAWCRPLCQSQKTKVHLQPQDVRIREDLLVMFYFLENSVPVNYSESTWRFSQVHKPPGSSLCLLLPGLSSRGLKQYQRELIQVGILPISTVQCVYACIGCVGGVREKGVIDQRCNQAGFVFLIGGWILGCLSLAEI